jgi:hypothetical protein
MNVKAHRELTRLNQKVDALTAARKAAGPAVARPPVGAVVNCCR